MNPDLYAQLKAKGLVTLSKLPNGTVQAAVTQYDPLGNTSVVFYALSATDATNAKTVLQTTVNNYTTFVTDIQAAK